MNHCCIPFCNSIRGKKDKSGFFEFPSNIKQRLLWQKVIIQACADRDISENLCKFEDRSVVCEKHFTEKDISRSTKRKRILPSAVPRIFQSFSFVKQTNLSDIKKSSNMLLSSPIQNSSVKKLETNIPLNSSKENKVDEASLKPVTTSGYDTFSQNIQTSGYDTFSQNIQCPEGKLKKETNCLEKPIIIKLGTTVSLTSSNQNNMFESNTSSKNLEFHAEDIKKEPRCKDKNKTFARQLHNKLKILKRENSNLRCRIKKSLKKRTLLTSNEKKLSLDVEQFKKIIDEKAENKLPAILLFEQIKNFGKKKIVLSNTALKFYFLWQKQFPGGYDFVRKMKIFSLPHRNTLTKYVEFSPEVEDDGSSQMQVTTSDEAENGTL